MGNWIPEEKDPNKIFTIKLGNGKKWSLRAVENTPLSEIWQFIKPVVPSGIFANITGPDGQSKNFLKGAD